MGKTNGEGTDAEPTRRPTSFRLRDDLHAALEKAAKTRRQTRKTIVELALEEYLAKLGLWKAQPAEEQ